ncbi:hypothetical protein [Niallia sp. 01092]|uniref:hypothetical protein n=1 Tax=unclassified Niallia TaxID=2837522 RepID=UPI003FCF4C61
MFIIFALILFVMIIFPRTRRKFINGFAVISLSLVSLIISAQVIYYDAIIVDELGLGGDEVTTFMCLAVIAFNFLNPMVYFSIVNHKKDSKLNP